MAVTNNIAINIKIYLQNFYIRAIFFVEDDDE
jgi:hypothetical protein